MVRENLEDHRIDVWPGIALPLPAADYVFTWMNSIRKGEAGPNDIGDHPRCGLALNQLSTLAHLIVHEDIVAAQLLVSNLLLPPSTMMPASTMLPSSTLIPKNDNYMRTNPFRRRRRKQGNLVQVILLSQKHFVNYHFILQEVGALAFGGGAVQSVSSHHSDSQVTLRTYR